MTVPCSAIIMLVNGCYHEHKGWLSTVSIMEGTKYWQLINPDPNELFLNWEKCHNY
jgi:hypothetical protein